MFSYHVDHEGCLVLAVGGESYDELREMYEARGAEGVEELLAEEYSGQLIWAPRSLDYNFNALTDSPVVTDEFVTDDEGHLETVGSVWHYPKHAIDCPYQRLYSAGCIKFDAA